MGSGGGDVAGDLRGGRGWLARSVAVITLLGIIGGAVYYWKSALGNHEKPNANVQVSGGQGNTMFIFVLPPATPSDLPKAPPILQPHKEESGATPPKAEPKPSPTVTPQQRTLAGSPLSSLPTSVNAQKAAASKLGSASQTMFFPTGEARTSYIEATAYLPPSAVAGAEAITVYRVRNMSPTPLSEVVLSVTVCKGTPKFTATSESTTWQGEQLRFGPWRMDAGETRSVAIEWVSEVGEIGMCASVSYKRPS